MTRDDHVLRNRAAWDVWAAQYAEAGKKAWDQKDPSWGIWEIPEDAVRILPDVKGKDVVELGCGTAYVSAWLARQGAKTVGVDNSRQQLKTALCLQKQHDIDFPLLHANAEQTPFADSSFDVAISEYGACIWCDPYLWIPEASRILRPGGKLVFLGNGLILMLCTPQTEEEIPARSELLYDYFGIHRFEFPNSPSVEFHLGYGDWIRLFRKNKLKVENLIELRPSENATTRYPFVKLDWARRWPSEEVWVCSKE
jgi:SAM-dependent methyltransferase